VFNFLLIYFCSLDAVCDELLEPVVKPKKANLPKKRSDELKEALREKLKEMPCFKPGAYKVN